MTITEAVTKKIRLFSRRKVLTLLSGNYDSLFRGSGLDIDSLREYVPGDDVKAIDWKATARTGLTHTRVYTALRDQRIIIVADTSRSMLLAGYTSLNKLDALYAVTVMLGNFVKRSHDVLALCAADRSARVRLSRFGAGSHHLEAMLQTMNGAIHEPAAPTVALSALYTQLLAGGKRRCAVFIISDSMPALETAKADLQKVAKRHQVFYVQLAPTGPFPPQPDDDRTFRDIETGQTLPADIAGNPKLRAEWQQHFTEWNVGMRRLCRSQGIAYGLITSAESTPDVVRDMFLQARRYALHRR